MSAFQSWQLPPTNASLATTQAGYKEVSLSHTMTERADGEATPTMQLIRLAIRPSSSCLATSEPLSPPSGAKFPQYSSLQQPRDQSSITKSLWCPSASWAVSANSKVILCCTESLEGGDGQVSSDEADSHEFSPLPGKGGSATRTSIGMTEALSSPRYLECQSRA
jgi:hypothetical protein